jgi:PqqD family protein of HPr-rel-A system
VTAPLRLRPRDDLTVVEIDGEAVVYDDATGDLHHLNPTATVVFSLCDGSVTARDLSAEIADAFGEPVEEIQRHVRGVLRRLREQNLLVPASGAGTGSGSSAHG